MIKDIRHRLIRWLARGERVNINGPQPAVWLKPSSSTYAFDGVEWHRV